MAYRAQSLSVLAYANGFTLWHYHTEDRNITLPAYFDDAENLIRHGDMMLIHAKDTSGTAIAGMYAVSIKNDNMQLTPIVSKSL